jgi:hypothetical protein
MRTDTKNRDGVVWVVTRPRVRWSGVGIPEGAKASLFFPNSSIWSPGSIQPPTQCVPGLFPGVKWGAKLTVRRHLEPNLKCGALHPYSPYDNMQWTGTIFVPFTYKECCSITLSDVLIRIFYGFPSLSTVQFLQDSSHINHCLHRIYVSFSPRQIVTFYEVQGSSPRCSSCLLTSDSPRY